jgi:hypothetical protein
LGLLRICGGAQAIGKPVFLDLFISILMRSILVPELAGFTAICGAEPPRHSKRRFR